MGRTYLSGNTYPVKDQLKALGCRFDAGRKQWYAEDDAVAERAKAVVQPTPLYNSPPPEDLGTADPAALAARFGRTAVGGVKVRAFTGYGKTPDPDGTVVRGHGGARFVQVAHGRPRYYSRDMLEDFDMFGDEPGHQYQWDGVEVEPTDAERAADEAAARAKAEALEAKRAAAAALKAERDAREAAALTEFREATEGLVETTARPEGITLGERSIVIRNEGSNYSAAREFTLPDGRAGWANEWRAGDDWRTFYFVPPDAAKAACLAQAGRNGVTPEKAREWLVKYSECYGADVYRAVVEAEGGAS